MLLLLLAALAQAPASGPAARDASMTCAAATIVATGDATSRVTAQGSYHVMLAARADPQGKSFHARFEELMEGLGAYAAEFHDGGARAGRAAAVVSECDRAWPLARSLRPAPLPAGAFERDLLCLSVVSFLEGVAQNGTVPGGAPTHPQIAAALQGFIARLTDQRVAAEGIRDEAAMTRRVGELLSASVELGNTEMVTRSCMAELGS